MNALEKYLNKLDNSTYDCTDVHTINKEFQDLSTELIEGGKQDIAIVSELNRQVFAVQKSFNYKTDTDNGIINGLSWQMSGTQTLEDKTVVPLYWPDVTKYTQKDFEYFEKRYNECKKNLFVKTEYGLMVYFGGKTTTSKHNDFKRQLCNELFQLSIEYLAKAEEDNDKSHYVVHFFNSLRLAFGIAEKSKLEPESTNIIKHIFRVHQEWDIKKDGTLRVLLDISGLLSDHYSLSNKIIDFKKVLDKNLFGAKELEKKHLWGAMYAVDRNIEIEQKRNKPISALLDYKAQLYEKLAIEAENKGNLACVNLAENALRIYKQIDNVNETKSLEKYYNKLRGKFQLSEIKQEMPPNYIKEMNEKISRAIEENDENKIIHYFIITPWYDSIQSIQERSKKLSKQSVFLSMLPTSVVDKFGNTVDTFYTDEEKEKFSFWNTYSIQFQLGTQTMHRFFIEAYKAKKLSFSSVQSYLENTWFADVIVRKYHGQEVNVKPIDTLKPGIKRLFEEIDKYFSNENYQCDFVTITDSLTLKIEGLLRYFCEKICIPTFKTKQTRQKGSNKIVMEKTLDDLLADIAHEPQLKPEQKTNFDEEDRKLIKYVLTEKAGLNLRNTVANSLMDIFEYSFENIVVLFCIVLKLSKYKFVEPKGEKKNDNSIK